MAPSDNSFIVTLTLLCQHHSVDAEVAFKRFLVKKSPQFKRTAADKECNFIWKLSENEAEVLGISTPAYHLRLTKGGGYVVFISTYRDGAGKIIKYADVASSQSPHERTGKTMAYNQRGRVDDPSSKSGGISELLSAARDSGTEGKHNLSRRRQ